MATEPTPPLSTSDPGLPEYVRAARPNPPSNRAAWYHNTAPTYAGIFLWFVFWDSIASNGLLRGGLAFALLGVLLGAVICHYLFYLVPGLLGMKTGLPLYIVGTSTFGVRGGLLMPGFLMGLLQFGWLAVNTFFSSRFLAKAITGAAGDNPFTDARFWSIFCIICVVWALAAGFMGLKGIRYVAQVASILPAIPFAVLIAGLLGLAGHANEYQPPDIEPVAVTGGIPVSVSLVLGELLLSTLAMAGAIVGFFATAGAAGVDFGMNNRDSRDVRLGGFFGIMLAILFTAGSATIIVAGAIQGGVLRPDDPSALAVTNALENLLDRNSFNWIMVGLTVAAFPGACFSAFIAANSFKTVMPRVNSFVSVGLGTVVSILLAITGLAGKLPQVFVIIGASFGPICGAMVADYLLAGRKWAGPRAGFNCAGWIAWFLGFIVGILPNLYDWEGQISYQLGLLSPRLSWTGHVIPDVAAAPVAAFFVGLLVYYVLAKIGWESRVLPYVPAAEQQPAAPAEAAVKQPV